MKKYAIGFIIGALFMLMINSFVFAEGFKKTIDVFLNNVNIELYGEKMDMNNILYDGTTYVPIRDISKAFDRKVEWNSESNTANITEIDINKKEEVEASHLDISNRAKLELDLISQELVNIQSDEEIQTMLNDYKEISEIDVQYIYFGKEDSGRMYVIPKIELPDDYDSRQRPWYINKENEYYISDIYIDIISEDKILTVSKPVYKNGKFLGVIGLDIKVSDE